MTKLLSLFGAPILTLFCVLSLPLEAHSQSKKKAAPAETKKAAPAASDEKLDVSDLERRYWTPKDTEFSVVQNRTYSKVKRLGVSLGAGTIITDAYVDSFDKSLTLNYFPTERYGFELNYTIYDADSSKVVQDFISLKGAMPDHNLIDNSIGVNFNWVPLYAKMSFLEKRILYYDMYISPGLVLVNYNQLIDPTATTGGTTGSGGSQVAHQSKSQIGFALDVSQVVFLNRNLAFRLDFKNRWYKNTVVDYYKQGTTDHPVASSKVINSNSLLFGFTYFFGGGGGE